MRVITIAEYRSIYLHLDFLPVLMDVLVSGIRKGEF